VSDGGPCSDRRPMPRPWGARVAREDRRWPDGEEGLREMCDYGASQVAAGKHDALHFDLFNLEEVEFIEGYMKQRHPDVRFGWVRAV
jgi:hypothetical protein